MEEIILVQLDNYGYLRSDSEICIQSSNESRIPLFKCHYAHEVCSGRREFKTETSIVDLLETNKLGKLVSRLCVPCTVPNQAASWSSWRGVEQIVIDFPKSVTANPPLLHSYTQTKLLKLLKTRKLLKKNSQNS